jgi:uncharacterized protein
MELITSSGEGKRRIVSLDMMRGFAILGIFLVNMLSFHSPFLYIEPLEWWEDPLDQGIYMFIDIFIQASFYPLFSMLFGYGLVMLSEKTQQKGLSFYPIALRRLFFLLIVGLAHAIFVWHGDILFNYALLGFIFLLFIKLSGKKMLVLGSIFYLLPNLLLLGLLGMTVLLMPGAESTVSVPLLASQSMDVYQYGTFLEITKQRIADWSYTNNVWGLVLMLFTLFPLFLIGGGAAKYKWFEKTSQYRKGFMIAFFITFILGLFFKLTPYLGTANLATYYMQDMFGGPLLAISYGLMIAHLAETKWLHKFVTLISSVGKMSFSHYLFQSILSTLIFYQYGLGLYGQVSVASGTLLVLIIYGSQLVFSTLWLKNYYYGPLEWIWRNFTYKSKQKLRKEVS